MVGSSVNFASVSCVRRCLDRERAALIGMMHGDRRYEGYGEAWRRGGLVTIECAGAAAAWVKTCAVTASGGAVLQAWKNAVSAANRFSVA